MAEKISAAEVLFPGCNSLAWVRDVVCTGRDRANKPKGCGATLRVRRENLYVRNIHAGMMSPAELKVFCECPCGYHPCLGPLDEFPFDPPLPVKK
jgi:hypothetical protein